MWINYTTAPTYCLCKMLEDCGLIGWSSYETSWWYEIKVFFQEMTLLKIIFYLNWVVYIKNSLNYLWHTLIQLQNWKLKLPWLGQSFYPSVFAMRQIHLLISFSHQICLVYLLEEENPAKTLPLRTKLLGNLNTGEWTSNFHLITEFTSYYKRVDRLPLIKIKVKIYIVLSIYWLSSLQTSLSSHKTSSEQDFHES